MQLAGALLAWEGRWRSEHENPEYQDVESEMCLLDGQEPSMIVLESGIRL